MADSRITRGSNAASKSALLLIDVINHFEFPDGARLLRQALPIAPRIERVKARVRQVGMPVIYVNDNFGQWRSDAAELLRYCLKEGCAGRDFVDTVKPDREDYCILKPMHSAFYQTPLDVLLRHLGVESLILAGIATNSCILCTAHDADMRDFQVTVLSDCCAARTAREHKQAIDHIGAMANARVIASSGLRPARER
ncbi:MAG TPA: isochorismatase family cysteine hydrolase [Bryobacteraceae bacterium]|nr:isochorismatase family cysteine hydrolase [Bryobacteraceae bacterium]